MKKPRKARAVASAAPEPREACWPLIYALFLLAMLPVLWWPQDQWVNEDELLMKNPYVLDAKIAKVATTRYWFGISNRANGDAVYRPFVLMTAMPFPKIPQGLRLLNWLTFLVCGLFLFLGARTRVAPDSPWPYLAAGLLLFHPISAELRSQIGGIADTMPLILGAAAFWLAEENPYPGLALVAMAPGFKETGFFWLLGYSIFQLVRRRTVITIVGGALFGGWAIFHFAAVGGWFTGTNPPEMVNPLVTLGFGSGIVARLHLLGHALRLLVFPVGLSSDYSLGTLPVGDGMFQLPVFLGIGFLALVAFNMRRLLAAGAFGAFVLTALAGTLFWNLHVGSLFGTYYFSLFQERAWLPLYFVLLLWAGALTSRLEDKGPAVRRSVTAAVAVVALVFLGLTLQRQGQWINTATLFLNDSAAHPQNARLHVSYGYAAAKVRDWNEARNAFSRALKAKPDFAEAHYRLSLVYDELREPAKAKEHRDEAARLGVKLPPSNL